MKWVLADHDAEAVSQLAASAGLPTLIARLMVVRGISDPSVARSFLSSELSSLSDPFLFRQMDRAVARIQLAISQKERIIVYGDYDVDGVTGSAVLVLALREQGACVDSYIPDRMTEGYGLNAASLRKLRADGVRLVVTVDCGITAVQEAALAGELGIDLIITDHHEIGDGREMLPAALAVLHPALLIPEADSDTRERVAVHTGVGVAFKLVQAVYGTGVDNPDLRKLLDLVTLGTVADMGRITGENRILVKEGLAMLSSGQPVRPGIAALKQVAGLTGKRVTVGTVGFSLAPRINASGRLEKADKAFRLLTCDDPDEALSLARELDELNRERQEVEERITADARKQCLRSNPEATGAFVLASEDWHPGVVGIVASRIVEEFYRPAVLIALKDGKGKGSARSIPGFDLYHGLSCCSELLEGFGGHKYAAGVSVAEDKIPDFREQLNKLVLDQFAGTGFMRTMMIDAPVTFNELTEDVMTDIDRMAPFGQGNPEPRLGAKGLEIVSLRTVGNGNKHMKMRLRQNSTAPFDAIAYGKGDQFKNVLKQGSRIAAVFTPRYNSWNGTASIELDIRDVKVEG